MDEAERRRDEQIRKEAAALLREVVSGVEAWARQAAVEQPKQQQGAAGQQGEGPGAAGQGQGPAGQGVQGGPSATDAAEPDWELLTQRANLLGGEAAVSLRRALETVQSDFESFQELRQQDALPTLVETLSEPLDGMHM